MYNKGGDFVEEILKGTNYGTTTSSIPCRSDWLNDHEIWAIFGSVLQSCYRGIFCIELIEHSRRNKYWGLIRISLRITWIHMIWFLTIYWKAHHAVCEDEGRQLVKTLRQKSVKWVMLGERLKVQNQLGFKKGGFPLGNGYKQRHYFSVSLFC